MACKACLKVTLLACILLLYLVFWYACDECIYVLGILSCSLSFFGAQYMVPACVAGVVASFFKGVHLGAGPFHFDMKWDV